ncbi:membrane protein [Cyclobacterium qasimii]|uniref:Membrane protein n=1 Tax=Cyclobacterium qasimii TaxID=1350429 RepID=A0A512CDP5_9BACT|nr:membrane protein [Cyclobacterium qasimii]
MEGALITNDAVVFGLLMGVLGFVFYTSASEHPFFKAMYKVVPVVLLCYFLPALFNTTGLISGEDSELYFVASRYLLPTSLVLLTLSIDLKSIAKLGPKALIMFLTGTFGVIIGGPVSLYIVAQFYPEVLGGIGADETWRGLATIAGSWIGGSANQTAMLELFGASPQLFSQMIAVDVIVANIWMAFLLYWAGKPGFFDKILKADTSAITALKEKVEAHQKENLKIPTLSDTMTILGLGFVITGCAHFFGSHLGDFIGVNYPGLKSYSLDSSFFWLVILATTGGLLLSFTRWRKLEGVGASRIGSVLLYILVATIGMQMDLGAVLDNPVFFLVGIIWMAFHILFMLIVAFIIKAPFFYVAIGSQANIGGAASAPIVASAFHPALAPVGVLLAVLGYGVGTYGAYICGILLQLAFGG